VAKVKAGSREKAERKSDKRNRVFSSQYGAGIPGLDQETISVTQLVEGGGELSIVKTGGNEANPHWTVRNRLGFETTRLSRRNMVGPSRWVAVMQQLICHAAERKRGGACRRIFIQEEEKEIVERELHEVTPGLRTALGLRARKVNLIFIPCDPEGKKGEPKKKRWTGRGRTQRERNFLRSKRRDKFGHVPERGDVTKKRRKGRARESIGASPVWSPEGSLEGTRRFLAGPRVEKPEERG